MTKQPWMKFYPADWRAEPSLRICSVAARGLWMEMLCIMHDAEPCGSLVIGGEPVTVAQLAGLAGSITARQTQALFDELAKAKVFSRDETGIIFSRRIRRDIERAEKDKANGKKGGNPRVKAPDNGGVNPPHNLQVDGGDKAQKPEARDQKPEKDVGACDARRPTSNELFRKLEIAAGGNLDPVSPTIEVTAPIEDLLAMGCDLDRHVLPVVRQKVATLSAPLRTWGARWLRDEILAAKAADPMGRQNPGEPRVDFGGGVSWPESTVRTAVDRWRADPQVWPDLIGPPPGKPGCRVPDRLLHHDRQAAE